MDLSRNLVKQFVEVTNDSSTSKEEVSVYGTIVEQNGSTYVKIDGSDEVTPITATVDVKAGDRVTVTVKNHIATITGNLTDPSASSEKVNGIDISVGDVWVKINQMGVQVQGMVTINSLQNGTTTIDGACIKTGTIDADRLNLTGAITFGDLNAGTQTLITDASQAADDAYAMADEAYDKADDAYDMADEAYNTVDGWTYRGTTYIDGACIKTGTVMASELIGGQVTLLTSDEEEAGWIDIDSAETANYAIDLHSNAALRLVAEYGNLYIHSDDDFSNVDAYINLSCQDEEIEFGDDYITVYINGDEVQTSDVNKKTNIEYGLDKYNSLFDSLKPVSFMFKKNSSGRRHIGLIAQDVEESIIQNGIDSVDFAPLVKRPKKNEDGVKIEGEYDYGLRYGEFIALCIEQIQTLKKRVAELESKIDIQ